MASSSHLVLVDACWPGFEMLSHPCTPLCSFVSSFPPTPYSSPSLHTLQNTPAVLSFFFLPLPPALFPQPLPCLARCCTATLYLISPPATHLCHFQPRLARNGQAAKAHPRQPTRLPTGSCSFFFPSCSSSSSSIRSSSTTSPASATCPADTRRSSSFLPLLSLLRPGWSSHPHGLSLSLSVSFIGSEKRYSTPFATLCTLPDPFTLTPHPSVSISPGTGESGAASASSAAPGEGYGSPCPAASQPDPAPSLPPSVASRLRVGLTTLLRSCVKR